MKLGQHLHQIFSGRLIQVQCRPLERLGNKAISAKVVSTITSPKLTNLTNLLEPDHHQNIKSHCKDGFKDWNYKIDSQDFPTMHMSPFCSSKETFLKKNQ